MPRCTKPLVNYKNGRFCSDHISEYSELCGIVGCARPIVADKLVCSRADHQKFQSDYEHRFSRIHYEGVARILRRAEEARLALSSEEQSTGFVSIPVHPHVASPLNDQESGTRVSHMFRANTTYCVQTIQRACGFPVAWGKMYRSESHSQVLKFLNKVFPPSYRPSFIGYDNACSLLGHIFSGAALDNRNWIKTTRFIVDGFHYITHRANDVLCRIHCNPAPADGSQPDLVVLKKDSNGQTHSTRAFNLETAEQFNSWVNPFEGPMEQMTNIRFDFQFHVLMLIYKERVEKRIQQKKDKNSTPEGDSNGSDDSDQED